MLPFLRIQFQQFRTHSSSKLLSKILRMSSSLAAGKKAAAVKAVNDFVKVMTYNFSASLT